MSKFFVFLYIDDQRVQDYLNLAIAILNPQEKWPAHVTIAGPFKNKLEIPRSLKFVQEVYILGRGRFDNGNRHTIYLHVGSRDMSSRIDKPDFPRAIPHLSLYNGRDKEIADILFNGLAHLSPYGVFYSRDLEVIESKQQYTFNFQMQIDTALLPGTAGRSLEQVSKMPKEVRVGLALEAVRIGLQRPFNLQQALHPDRELRRRKNLELR